MGPLPSLAFIPPAFLAMIIWSTLIIVAAVSVAYFKPQIFAYIKSKICNFRNRQKIRFRLKSPCSYFIQKQILRTLDKNWNHLNSKLRYPNNSSMEKIHKENMLFRVVVMYYRERGTSLQNFFRSSFLSKLDGLGILVPISEPKNWKGPCPPGPKSDHDPTILWKIYKSYLIFNGVNGMFGAIFL